MKFLVDTHILLWSLFNPKKIKRKAFHEIQNPENDIYVSTITFWEISLKYSIGKLELEGIVPDELPEFANKMDFEILNFLPEEAASFYRLPRLSHKDPFDRMIIWQAIRNDMIFISKDNKMPEYEKFGLTTLFK